MIITHYRILLVECSLKFLNEITNAFTALQLRFVVKLGFCQIGILPNWEFVKLGSLVILGGVGHFGIHQKFAPQLDYFQLVS